MQVEFDLSKIEMSSLAAQLAGIKTNSNATILDKSKRKKYHSVSVIFEAKEAATQDYESIYYTCIEKFREMVQVDKRYALFAKTLFSETSIRFDRQIQQVEHVDSLNKTIQQFFMLNANYLQLTPSFYCLEWLIRRFQVHVHNAEDLLLSVLPWYDTPQFMRILDVIPPSGFGSVFRFLNASKTSAQNPSKNTLVRVMANDPTFYQLVNHETELIVQKGYEYNRQLVFWSSMTVWAIMAKKESNDPSILDFVLPVLSSLIILKEKPSVQIACYMILVVLCSQFSLDESVTNATILTITKTWSSGSQIQGIACVSQLVRYSDARIKPFDIEEWNRIKAVPKIAEEIVSLAKSHNVSAFAVRWALSLFQYAPDRVSDTTQVIKSLSYNNTQLKSIIRALLSSLTSIASPSNLHSIRDSQVELIEWFLQNYSQLIFEVLNELDLNIDDLEIQLQTAIKRNDIAVNGSPASETVVEEPVRMSTNASEIERESSNLSVMSDASFLNLDSYLNAEPRFKLWVDASVSKEIDTNKLVSLMRISEEAEASFLTAIAISPFPLIPRLRALELLIPKLEKDDYEVLIPSIIRLLSDNSAKVRKLASQCIKAMVNSSNQEVWGSQSVYGQSIALATLGKKALAVLKSIDGKSEECIMDPTYVVEVASTVGKSSWMEFLIKQACTVKFASVLNVILKILKGHKGIGKGLEPLYESWIKNRLDWKTASKRERMSFADLEASLLATVSTTDKAGFTLLENGLLDPSHLATAAADRIAGLWQTFSLEKQNQLLNKLLDISLNSDSPFDSLPTLQRLDLTCENFNELLDHYRLGGRDADGVDNSKRRRRRSSNGNLNLRKASEDVVSYAEVHLRKITLILELLEQNVPKIENPALIFNSLFDILNELVTFGTNSNIPVLYTQGLLADCLIGLLEKMKSMNQKVDSLNSVRVDVIVSCIRTSSNPQIQNKFLLLVAALANICPNLVFHSVMPIFTFMGANTVRLDNDYSAFVIQQTISKVIPALVKNGDKVEEIEIALRSFVAAFPHIPRHRRNKLFGALVKTLGPQESLYKLLLLLGQKYAEMQSRKKLVDSKAIVHFTIPFLRSFSVEDQLSAGNSYVEYVLSLNEEVEDTKSVPLIRTSDSMGVDAFRFFLYRFLAGTWGSEKIVAGTQSLRAQISSRSEFGSDNLKLCTNMINMLLSATSQEEEDTSAAFEVLSKCLELLPINVFVTAMTKLIEDKESGTVKLKALELVARKFEFENNDNKTFDAALQAVEVMHSSLKKSSGLLESELIDTIDLMISRFPRIDATIQLELLDTLCGANGLQSSDIEVEVSAVNCINSLARNLGARIIGYFPKILPVLFSKCSESLNSSDKVRIEEGKTLQYATFALVGGLIVKIPSFMTSCTTTVLNLIFSSNIPTEPRETLLQLIGEKIDPQTVLSAYVSTWSSALSAGLVSINLFFRNLDILIEQTPKKLVGSKASQLVGMLLKCFTVRSTQRFSDHETNEMETKMVKTTVQMVLKLNDKVFRPQFNRMVRWAFEGENTVMAAPLRHLVMMKFVVKLLGQLKSIVTNYYGYLLDPVCSALTTEDDSYDVHNAVVKLIYQSLILSFSSDNDDFWQSPSRFDKILSTLFEQLNAEHIIHGTLLVKTYVALAETSPSQEHRKKINDGLSACIGPNKPAHTKIWAVRVLSALYAKLGEEWVTVLPQLVPLIAELLDDNNEEVENETRRKLVPVIEDVLGESLDRYLS